MFTILRNLCRTAALLGASGRDPLEQLSYGERLELQAALNRKREELAVDLLRAGVGARMVRIRRRVSWRIVVFADLSC